MCALNGLSSLVVMFNVFLIHRMIPLHTSVGQNTT